MRKLEIAGRKNLYFVAGYDVFGRPDEVFAFVKCPQARLILGRWQACPNASVRSRLSK